MGASAIYGTSGFSQNRCALVIATIVSCFVLTLTGCDSPEAASTVFTVMFESQDEGCGIDRTSLLWRLEDGAWAEWGDTVEGDAGGFEVAPPAGDGVTGSGIRLTKVIGDTINVVYDIATCNEDHAVMLYGTLGSFGVYQGAVDSGCNVGVAGSADFDIAADNVWFNLVWANSADAGGHPGFATAGDRTINAVGFCSVATDDHSDTVCD